MARREFDTFIDQDPSLLPEDQEMELIIRDLTPDDRRYKYRSFFANVLVSRSPSKHPDRLWVKSGRGLLSKNPWSVKILRKLNTRWSWD